MKKSMISAVTGLAAGLALTAGVAFAQDEGAAVADETPMVEPVAVEIVSVDQCSLNGEAPKMPKGKTATAEDRAATIQAIKAFQAALGEYRTCVSVVSDNEALELDVRQEALEAYNKSVDAETKMVEKWQKFAKAYDKANK